MKPSALSLSLKGMGVDEGAPETFGLNWPGKQQARLAALTPASGRLVACPRDGINHDSTGNLLVEGDNLDVLKLLMPDYAGRVRMIYIDPPYNTGNSFIYNDTFRAGRGWAQAHGPWLSMMYPRLMLAREMLREDGLIFISIGDEELDSLTLIGREIFGDENFCGHLVWEKKKKPSFLDGQMGRVAEFIVCFARNRAKAPALTAGTVTLGKKYPFNNAGNGVQVLTFPAGSVRFGCGDGIVAAQDMSAGNIRTELLDAVEIVDGVNAAPFRLRGEWRYAQATLDALIQDGALITIRKAPFRPNLVSRSRARKKTATLLSYRTNGVPTNEDATAELRALFGADVMSYPKPSGLMSYLIDAATQDGDIVMDFFAGSGSTAHGLWRADAMAGARRRFVLVQSPEPTRQPAPGGRWKTGPAWGLGFATIFELACERLRRVAHALGEAQAEAHDAPMRADLGFRVLRYEGGEKS